MPRLGSVDYVDSHFGTKKGIKVLTVSSVKEREIQVADLIASAFRLKLMKKSDLFQVDLTRVSRIVIPEKDVFRKEAFNL